MNRGAETALLAMMLILPLSALLARRVPLGQTVKMALAWLAVFVAGLLIVWQLYPGQDSASRRLPQGDQPGKIAS